MFARTLRPLAGATARALPPLAARAAARSLHRSAARSFNVISAADANQKASAGDAVLVDLRADASGIKLKDSVHAPFEVLTGHETAKEKVEKADVRKLAAAVSPDVLAAKAYHSSGERALAVVREMSGDAKMSHDAAKKFVTDLLQKAEAWSEASAIAKEVFGQRKEQLKAYLQYDPKANSETLATALGFSAAQLKSLAPQATGAAAPVSLNDKVAAQMLGQHRNVILVCWSGVQSKLLAPLLEAAGTSVSVVDGGLDRWASCGLPVELSGSSDAAFSEQLSRTFAGEAGMIDDEE